MVTDDVPELELWEELLEDESLPEEDPLVEESSDDDPQLPDDPVVEDPVVVELVEVDPFDAFVVVAAELAPRLPVAAITPKASAKVASAAAVMRRRIILMRRARSRSRLRTSGFEVGGGVAGMPAS